MNLTTLYRTLLVISGPTAVGKTSAVVSLAEQYHVPIISADSRQFFREMKIGTAYPTDEELARAQRYLVGMLSIHDYYNIYMYEQAVLQLLDRLFEQYPFVLMEGGSPQYIAAVCHGVDETPDADPQIRDYVNRMFQNNGIEALRAQLQTLDPDFYATVDKNNHKRMIRAIEVSLQTGRPYSSLMHHQEKERDFTICRYYLNRPREELFARIGLRVDKMMEAGLEAEARALYPYRELNALNTVGYKELFDYFDGKCSLEKAVENIKTHTRRYAKKQLIWFRKEYQELDAREVDARGLADVLQETVPGKCC
ncbi:MAG: tRNA (adenosine(37)-N6)-dimethylallyltransferase MiaA [Bacteroidales bacterium]|nr:tRNA (adenosine(37)-N6)-dimethylallyltransferase MiaA [Bacteroidales bacterium]